MGFLFVGFYNASMNPKILKMNPNENFGLVYKYQDNW